jgi:flagellar biogenesis protein FliO
MGRLQVSALLVQGAAALAIVVALLYAQRQLRQGRRPAGAAVLEVRERRPLGRESGVAVVAWQGREVLVGYGASGVATLLAADAPRDEVLP